MPAHKKYTKKLGEYICEEVAKGRTMQSISDEIKIARCTIHRWLLDDDDFWKLHQKAKEVQMQGFVDDLNQCINDDPPNTGDKVMNAAIMQQRRLKLDGLRWLAGKLAPRLYGDKLNVDHKVEGGATIQIMSYKSEPKSREVIDVSESGEVASLPSDAVPRARDKD